MTYEVSGDELKILSWKNLISFFLAFLFIFFPPLFWGLQTPFLFLFWSEGNLSVKQTEITQAVEGVREAEKFEMICYTLSLIHI